ncbi:MAG: phosphatidate cytidylyltransferase [Candidatus Kapabacteria bacterium]|nr:phosphatidate cytidylyltransferase [Candidatus Kapabacteria bacterium]
MSELIKRVLVAIIGIPLAILLIYFGGLFFTVAIISISSIGLYEFYIICKSKNFESEMILGIIFGAIIQILYFYFIQKEDLLSTFLSQFIAFIILMIILMIVALKRGVLGGIARISTTLTGIMYISMFFLSLIGIRSLFNIEKALQTSLVAFSYHVRAANYVYGLDDRGCGFMVLSIFIGIWICDTAAYFIGRRFGKHKIYPDISPKKSWEGGIAGLIAGGTAFVLSVRLFNPEFPFLDSLFIGMIVGITGQIGDFAESLLKRDANLKDSSNIIPGHGGILDRFDSILFVSPLVYIYLLLLVMFGK